VVEGNYLNCCWYIIIDDSWLGSIRLGLALNTLVSTKYVHYLLCATYFGAMVVDVKVFTVKKNRIFDRLFSSRQNY